jgi:hypothetical protein
MENDNKTNKTNKKSTKYPFLLTGDLNKVAKKLGIPYQRVRDISTGRVSHHIVEATLAKLNGKREEQAQKTAEAISEAIINENL